MSQDFLLDFKDLDAFIKAQGATKAQWEKALRTTLVKMARWVKTLSRRGLSKELGMPQKVLNFRSKSGPPKKMSGGLFSHVWFGLNPVGLEYLNPKKSGAGVTTRATGTIAGAFIHETAKGKRIVFKREGAKRAMTKGASVGKSKQPLVKVEAPIQAKSESYLEHQILDGTVMRQKFLDTFEHELNWRMAN